MINLHTFIMLILFNIAKSSLELNLNPSRMNVRFPWTLVCGSMSVSPARPHCIHIPWFTLILPWIYAMVYLVYSRDKGFSGETANYMPSLRP